MAAGEKGTKVGDTATTWGCHSIADRQAATAIKKLLAAQANGRHGASIKSLTLAPHIQAKKATFKVTCETLKALPVIRQLLGSCGLLEKHG
jgi:putative methyltransferase